MITNNRQFISRLPRIFLCLLTAVLLHACKQPGKTPLKNEDTGKVSKTGPLNAPAKKAATDTANTDECPRGVSEPVVKKNVFPDANFTLQADGQTGIETLTLKDGDKLTLKQAGCEYYVLNFRFETSRFAADTTDVAYWGNAALLLLRQVSKGLDVPLEISKALNKLSARLEKDKSGTGTKLALEEEIDFGGPDPRQYITIDRVTRLANQHHAIELSISYGPI